MCAAMFERFGVNSLSAFRHKFWAYELDPAVGGSRIGQPASALSSPPTSSGSRSRWQVQQLGKETYVGEMMDGRRHGCGILLVKVGHEVARLSTQRSDRPAALSPSTTTLTKHPHRCHPPDGAGGAVQCAARGPVLTRPAQWPRVGGILQGRAF